MRKPGQPKKPESELLKNITIKISDEMRQYLKTKKCYSKYIKNLIEKDMNKSVDKY